MLPMEVVLVFACFSEVMTCGTDLFVGTIDTCICNPNILPIVFFYRDQPMKGIKRNEGHITFVTNTNNRSFHHKTASIGIFCVALLYNEKDVESIPFRQFLQEEQSNELLEAIANCH